MVRQIHGATQREAKKQQTFGLFQTSRLAWAVLFPLVASLGISDFIFLA